MNAPQLTDNERNWLVVLGAAGTLVYLGSLLSRRIQVFFRPHDPPMSAHWSQWPVPRGLPPIQSVQFQPITSQAYAVMAIFRNGSRQRIGTYRLDA